MQFLGVLPEERRKVALLLLHYVWVVAVTIAGKSVRDAYFLSRYEKSILPLMAVAAAIAVALAIAFFTRVERNFRSRVLAPTASLIFAASLAMLHFSMARWTIPVLYVWMEVINVVTILQFWLLAAELLDPRQAKRLFPIIGGGGSLAAILIGPQLKPFSKAYGSDTLLWLVCGLLVGAALVAMITTRLPAVPIVRSQKKSTPRAGWKLGSAYLRMTAAVVVCAAVVSAVVDYQFKIISADTLRTETDLVGFFGMFYAATGASTLLLQFVVAARAFQRYGVVIVMTVLPVMLGLGSVSILIWPVLYSAVLARFSDQTFRFTLHNGGLELLWLPVSPSVRSQTKPFVSGTLKSVTEGAAGVMIFLLLPFLSAAQLSFISLAFCGTWAVALFKLRGLYISELQTAIAHRRLPPEDLAVSATDALTVKVIDKALVEGDTVQRLFVLGLIADIPLTPWRDTLQQLLSEGTAEVKARILQVAGKDNTIVTHEVLSHLATKEGTEGIEAIRAIGSASAEDLRETVAKRLNDAEPAIRAAACGALIKLNGSGNANARETLNAMLRSKESKVRAAALEESSGIDGMLSADVMSAALSDSSIEVRVKALDMAAVYPDEKQARLIAASLSEPSLFLPARHALSALPPATVLPVLTEHLRQTLPTDERRASLRAMKICLVPGAHSVLLEQIDAQRPGIANQASETLLAISRQVPLSRETEPTAEARRSDVLLNLVRLDEALQGLPDSKGTHLLRDYLENAIANLLPAMVRLSALKHPSAPIETCIEILHTHDRARLPFVLELLDTLLSPAERSKVSPLLEPSSSRLTPAESTSEARGWLSESVYADDEWLRSIAIDYVLAHCHPEISEQIEWNRVPATTLLREVTASCISRNPEAGAKVPGTHIAAGNVVHDAKETRPMLTTLEKTILLKSVPLFEDIPGEELSRVAQIAEEKSFPAGTTIFRDGDHADCLYVIVSGSVSIQKRGKELAVLAQGSSIGEMAVLDSSPRSADVISVDATQMLRVEQEQFLEIMQSNGQIMQGVVRMLLGRLRRMDDMLADKAPVTAGKAG